MNEIEKLYENAGIEKIHNCKSCEYEEEYLCPDNCPHQQLIYPPFTAEKQLELIKWMIKTNRRYFIQDIIADYFSETLAGVFNLYWQDLTEEEKEQIRNILAR